MANSVGMILSKKQLKLQMGSHDRDSEFTVMAINESEKFVSFKLNLSLQDLNRRVENDWYRVEPSFCAKKPPGDSTEFRVKIIKPPLKLYDATIELQVKIFAIEDPKIYAEETLNLAIERPELPLRLFLPVKQIKVAPGERFKIPVLLYNLSSNTLDVTLVISANGLRSNWFRSSQDRVGDTKVFSLEPVGEVEDSFLFCPPQNVTEALRQEYDFKVEVRNDTFTTDSTGTIEILPQGHVYFDIQRGDLKRRNVMFRLLKKYFNYNLIFRNNSNLRQQISLDREQLQEGSNRDFNYQLDDGDIVLSPGEEKTVNMKVWRKYTWRTLLQFTDRLQLIISPLSIDPNSGKISSTPLQPESRNLKISMFFVIQFLTQILLAILAMVLWWLSPRLVAYHNATVNVVRFNRDASTVISGSSDRTLRRWRVDRSLWRWPARYYLQHEEIVTEAEKAVRTMRELPGSAKDDDIFVVGLENGTIQLWDVSRQRMLAVLSLVRGGEEKRNNRIFDIYIVGDYLFTSHGSNSVYRWNLQRIRAAIAEAPQQPVLIKIDERKWNNVVRPIYSKFVPLALAMTEKNNFLVLAGQYNKLAFMNFINDNNTANQIYEIESYFIETGDNFLKTFLGQHSYITSLSIADRGGKNIMAMADNQGYITLWNLDRINECLRNNLEPMLTKCSAIVEQWSDGHDYQPVRSIALTPDGCYMASTGDDGRVQLWFLDAEGKIIDNQTLAHFPRTRLNSVDIKEVGNYLWVVSDAPSYRVQLYRTQIDSIQSRNCL